MNEITQQMIDDQRHIQEAEDACNYGLWDIARSRYFFRKWLGGVLK